MTPFFDRFTLPEPTGVQEFMQTARAKKFTVPLECKHLVILHDGDPNTTPDLYWSWDGVENGTVHGLLYSTDDSVTFDDLALQPGKNTIVLWVPAGAAGNVPVRLYYW